MTPRAPSFWYFQSKESYNGPHRLVQLCLQWNKLHYMYIWVCVKQYLRLFTFYHSSDWPKKWGKWWMLTTLRLICPLFHFLIDNYSVEQPNWPGSGDRWHQDDSINKKKKKWRNSKNGFRCLLLNMFATAGGFFCLGLWGKASGRQYQRDPTVCFLFCWLN